MLLDPLNSFFLLFYEYTVSYYFVYFSNIVKYLSTVEQYISNEIFRTRLFID